MLIAEALDALGKAGIAHNTAIAAINRSIDHLIHAATFTLIGDLIQWGVIIWLVWARDPRHDR